MRYIERIHATNKGSGILLVGKPAESKFSVREELAELASQFYHEKTSYTCPVKRPNTNELLIYDPERMRLIRNRPGDVQVRSGSPILRVRLIELSQEERLDYGKEKDADYQVTASKIVRQRLLAFFNSRASQSHFPQQARRRMQLDELRAIHSQRHRDAFLEYIVGL